jgi:hypothetical protein
MKTEQSKDPARFHCQNETEQSKTQQSKGNEEPSNQKETAEGRPALQHRYAPRTPFTTLDATQLSHHRTYSTAPENARI